MTDNTTNQEETEDGELSNRGYSLVKKLGEGGYAKVYLAEYYSKSSANVVYLACKVIDIEKTPKKFAIKFLPRELHILSKIHHPHIISILSIYQRKNNFYIFMRYAENGDLLDYIIKNGAINENQARIWTRQIALAVQYLHALEIAHRDLKCENILLTKYLNSKITDFGFARRVVSDPRLPREMSNTFCGSVSYAPPEILRGEPYSPKAADIWSLGILIYTMLNKSNPFDAKNLKTLQENQIKKNWKFRSKYEKNISNEVKHLIGKMLEPDVAKRLTIEKVINSAWIAMNPRLKSLNTAEYNSLKSAMDDIKSAGINTETTSVYEDEPRTLFSIALMKINTNRTSLTVFKEAESAFNLQMNESKALEESDKKNK